MGSLWCCPILVIPDNRLYLVKALEGKVKPIESINGVSVKVSYDFSVPNLSGEKCSTSNYFLSLLSGLKRNKIRDFCIIVFRKPFNFDEDREITVKVIIFSELHFLKNL